MRARDREFRRRARRRLRTRRRRQWLAEHTRRFLGIPALSLAMVAAATGITVGTVYWLMWSQMESSFREQQKTLIAIASENLSLSLAVGSAERSQAVMDILDEHSIFHGLQLLDPDGLVLLRRPAGFDLPAGALPRLFAGKTHVAGPLTYTAAHLLDESGQPVGHVVLTFTRAPLEERARSAMLATILFVVPLLLTILSLIAVQMMRAERALCLRSELEEARDDAMRSAQRAQDANDLKGVFLANMSHEMRTPMHAILSFASLGLSKMDRLDKKDLRKYFEKIDQSGRRFLGLLNDLLDLSKLESRTPILNLRETNVGLLIGTIGDELSSLLAEKGLHMDASERSSLRATVDRDKILQVLRNLIGNAVKFSKPGGTIRVGMAQDGPRVRIWVADEGIGIPADEIGRIFDKFVQSSRTRTAAGGTGLGLAISKEIVERHGGRIWAENRPEGGARFQFELPLQLDHEVREVRELVGA